jgi:hypothetical protein
MLNICTIFANIMQQKKIIYVLAGIVVFLCLCIFAMVQGRNDFYLKLYENTKTELEACNYERLRLQERLLKKQ